MPYIGNDIQFGELTSQSFTGDNSTTAFTLSYTVANPTSLIVTIDNVIQEPTTAYTVAGTTLTCTSAPAIGDTIHVRYLGRVVDVANAAILQDSDQDTKIQVEESADEDTIRFDIAGAEDFTMTANTFTAVSGSTIAAQALTATTLDVVGDITGATLNADGDTSAGDNAAIGYTAAEGLILTGQGSTNDITIKRDDDTAVLEVATGQSDIEVTGGNIFFGTANKGIYLGVTSATASNLLDDYEEGTYTALITNASSGSYTVDSAQDTLSYRKIGHIVHVFGRITSTAESSPNGQVRVNLPFTSATLAEGSDSAYTNGVNFDNSGDADTDASIVGWIQAGSTRVIFYQLTHGTNATGTLDQTDLDGSWGVSFMLTYAAA